MLFPDKPSLQLITVPSCPSHNNDNSKDVEYVRNVMVASWGVNTTGEEVQKKAFRSFDKSPKLLRQTFRDSLPRPQRCDGGPLLLVVVARILDDRYLSVFRRYLFRPLLSLERLSTDG